ncbi:MAG: fimbrillin family protein [Muribaculum sp.]|nr:fimbrillin family protein [Muribaculum sp.]
MSHLKSSYIRFAGGMAALVAVSLFSSCEDDTFDRLSTGGTGISFDVEVTGDWTAGSRADSQLDIREMTCDSDADPLYLVTEISSADADTMSVSAASSSAGRAAPVTDTAGFHDSFGLSAMCYTGTPGDDFPLNFAHDLKMHKSGSQWTREDGLKLQWVNSGTLKFFAYSPHSSAFDDSRLIHSPATDTGAPVLTYTVPDDAKDQTDIMTAVTVCDGGQKGAVSLTFTHALTAVTVKTGEAMLGGTIKSVTIKNIYGKGSHRIGSGTWTAAGTPRDFTISFGDDGKKLPSADKDNNNYYTDKDSEITGGEITMMMIPQTLPADAGIDIEFTDELTGTDRHLKASLAGTTWGTGKKVVYSLNSTGIVVEPVAELTVDGKTDARTIRAHGFLPGEVALKAFAKVAQTGAETKIISLPFTLQTSVDGGKTWTASQWQPEPALSDPQAALVSKNGIALPAQSVYEEMLKKMGNNPEQGTPSSSVDLSGGGETANCYIISAPGYYSLPLVYGNARTVGESSYKYLGTKEQPNDDEENHRVLRDFVNHENEVITGAKITGATDAVLIWQDAPELVTEVKLDGNMLKFHARADRFVQGNAVVAVRNSAKVILWSWHIWATNYKWDGSADIHTKSRSTLAKDYYFAPCNLGYCDPHGGNPARDITLRVEFELPDGKTKKLVSLPIKISQDEIVASIAGDNPFYQWGRKDPMLPGVYNRAILTWAKGLPHLQTEYNMKNKAYFVDDPQYAIAPAQSGVSIGTSIQNPHQFYMSKRPDVDNYDLTADYLRRHWHDGRNTRYKHHAILNFWDSQMDEQGAANTLDNANNERNVTKTIYDPCPPGYKMPPPNAFSMFSKKAGTTNLSEANAYGSLNEYDKIEDGSQKIGWNIATGENGSGQKIFFPATGLRDMGVRGTEVIDGYNDGKSKETTITWPAHADLTFIATSGFTRSSSRVVTGFRDKEHKDTIWGTKWTSSTLLFYLDNRLTGSPQAIPHVSLNGGTNNAYGFTVRPIRE